LAEEIKKSKAKGEVHALECDVGKEDDVKRVIKWTRDNLGGVDVMVNNAGVVPLTSLSGKDNFMFYSNSLVSSLKKEIKNSTLTKSAIFVIIFYITLFYLFLRVERHRP